MIQWSALGNHGVPHSLQAEQSSNITMLRGHFKSGRSSIIHLKSCSLSQSRKEKFKTYFRNLSRFPILKIVANSDHNKL